MTTIYAIWAGLLIAFFSGITGAMLADERWGWAIANSVLTILTVGFLAFITAVARLEGRLQNG